MITLKDGALIAVTAGALIYTYAVNRSAKKKLSETRKQLLSMQDFADLLTQNDIALQKELVESNAELNRRMLQLATLLEIAKELMVTRSPRVILNRIPIIAGRLMPSKAAAIRILSKDGSSLNLRSHLGLPTEYVKKNKSVPLDTSLFAQVIRESKSVAGLGDFEASGSCWETANSEEVIFHLFVPIVVQGEVTGVLSVYTSKLYDRTSDDIQLLTILAAFASAALENARLYEELDLAYDELSSLKDYNENILESVTIGLAVVNRDLTITTWNTGMEDITGIPREAAIGHNYFQVLPFHREAGFGDLLREVLKDGVTRELRKLRYTTPDERERVVFSRACPLMSLGEKSEGEESNPAGASGLRQPLGAVVVMEDVTVTVSLEEQLRWAERMKVVGEFSAGIAHEINNPIGIISACAEHLARKLEKESELSHDYLKPLKAIEEEAARCSSIIKNLTVFSRRKEFNLKSTDIGYVVLAALEAVKPQAEQSGVIIEFSDRREGRDGFCVLADEAQLRQVFLNLALNAIQAMPEGGLLQVRITPGMTSATHETIEIDFRDTGCGIAKEDLEKVFTPFFTTRSSGIGLGLAVSHGIIQGHGGALTVHSKEGQGSSFVVSLPALRHATP